MKVCLAIAITVFFGINSLTARAIQTGLVDYQVLPRFSAPTEPASLLINSPKELSDYLERWPGAAMNIDFNKYTLLVISLGIKPMSGYSIVFTSIFNNGLTVIVNLIEAVPGPNCAGTAVVVYPAAVALIPHTSLPVRFDAVKATLDCNENHESIGVAPIKPTR